MAQNDFLHGVEVKNTPATHPAVDVNLSTIGVIGIAPFADPQAFPLDTPVLVSGSDTQLIGKLVATAPAGAADVGTLPAAVATMLDECSPLMVVVRVAGNTSYDAETVPEIVGGIDSSGAYKGVHAFLAAESVIGYRPRLLCAPGYCHLNSNAVLAELKTVADKLRAVVFADGPNTTAQDAIAMAQAGGSRTMLIDPWIIRETNGVQAVVPPSAKFAALQAYSDQQNGFWRSLSNQELHGVLGLSRPVDFVLGDQTCAANILNANNVATIVRRAGTGYVS
ncbi:MAG: phage tail sheath subtilisin-like domain-containing protein [Bombella apis]|uniref:phage tail sheath subtilisin-like domain-containing protein n=1 Tax=Bombella apis TaxID=1785988 RepID=UPI0023F19068|nr:phage tail sheath subtilisin-like domain-containing protein [Bombella apis]MCT6819479.1 phage tail sheath subtilisin-like domain-containing protein [Bombella apis]